MKIAICFSGQPRFVSECYPGIKSNIIEANRNHDIDTFVHTWFSEEISEKILYHNEFSSFSGEAKIKKNAVDEIKKLYDPLDLMVEPPLNFLPIVNYEGSFSRQMDASRKMGVDKTEYVKMRLNSTIPRSIPSCRQIY